MLLSSTILPSLGALSQKKKRQTMRRRKARTKRRKGEKIRVVRKMMIEGVIKKR